MTTFVTNYRFQGSKVQASIEPFKLCPGAIISLEFLRYILIAPLSITMYSGSKVFFFYSICPWSRVFAVMLTSKQFLYTSIYWWNSQVFRGWALNSLLFVNKNSRVVFFFKFKVLEDWFLNLFHSLNNCENIWIKCCERKRATRVLKQELYLPLNC